MKRFVLKGSAFLAIGVLLLQVMAGIVERASPDGTAFLLRRDREKVREVLDDAARVDAIVVGNSHGDSIDFGVTPFTGRQLARAWGDVFEVDYYLDYLVPRLPRLETVFVPISYNTFYQDNGKVPRLQTRRGQMYRTIPAWTWLDGDEAAFLQARFEAVLPVKTVLREDHWRGVFQALVAPAAPPANTGGAEACAEQTTEQLAEQARTRVAEQVELARVVVAQRPTIVDDVYGQLESIVGELRTRRIRVVFFTPPYSAAYRSYYEAQDANAIAVMQRMLQRLEKAVGAEYYDFSNHAVVVGQPALFADSDHLNACGKRLFTKEFGERLLGRRASRVP